MVHGSMKCVKLILFVFNFVFFVIGLALIIIGGIGVSLYSKYSIFIEGVSGAAVLVIILGVIVFLVGFLGCWGAVRENRCMVRTYAILLIIILILEVSAAIAGFVLSDEVEQMLDDGMMTTMNEYTHNQVARDGWDTVQRELKCCGVHNASDWLHALPNNNYSTPTSCCKVEKAGCSQGVLHMFPKEQAEIIYVQGCLPSLENTLHDNEVAIGCAAVTFAIVQLIGILFAFCLDLTLKREYEYV